MNIPQCPSCKARIWREALGARGRPFKCGNCKTLLVKDDKGSMVLAILLANAVLILPFLFPKIWGSDSIVVIACFIFTLAVGVAVGLLVYLLGAGINLAESKK